MNGVTSISIILLIDVDVGSSSSYLYVPTLLAKHIQITVTLHSSSIIYPSRNFTKSPSKPLCTPSVAIFLPCCQSLTKLPQFDRLASRRATTTRSVHPLLADTTAHVRPLRSDSAENLGKPCYWMPPLMSSLLPTGHRALARKMGLMQYASNAVIFTEEQRTCMHD